LLRSAVVLMAPSSVSGLQMAHGDNMVLVAVATLAGMRSCEPTGGIAER
jgi:hypothetical protein